MILLQNNQQTISVINRKTGTRYNITVAYYKRHRNKYILASRRQKAKMVRQPIDSQPSKLQPANVSKQRKALDVKRKQRVAPTIHIKDDSRQLSDKQEQYIAKYTNSYSFEIYFLVQPKYDLPQQLKQMQGDLQYLCSIKDRDLQTNQLIDVYLNQMKTKNIKLPYIVCVSDSFYRNRSVKQNEQSEYFKMAKHVYNILYNPQEDIMTQKKHINYDLSPGGKGDHTDPETLDQDQLQVGTLVQLQHTNNKQFARQIAIDHLTQYPTYYTILLKAGLVDEKPALRLARKLGILNRKKVSQPEIQDQIEESIKQLKQNIYRQRYIKHLRG